LETTPTQPEQAKSTATAITSIEQNVKEP